LQIIDGCAVSRKTTGRLSLNDFTFDSIYDLEENDRSCRKEARILDDLSEQVISERETSIDLTLGGSRQWSNLRAGQTAATRTVKLTWKNDGRLEHLLSCLRNIGCQKAHTPYLWNENGSAYWIH
jgi:hypothetical protein